MARIRLMTSIKAVLRILKSVGTLILLIPYMHKIASSHVNENISNFIEGRKKRFDKFLSDRKKFNSLFKIKFILYLHVREIFHCTKK